MGQEYSSSVVAKLLNLSIGDDHSLRSHGIVTFIPKFIHPNLLREWPLLRYRWVILGQSDRKHDCLIQHRRSGCSQAHVEFSFVNISLRQHKEPWSKPKVKSKSRDGDAIVKKLTGMHLLVIASRTRSHVTHWPLTRTRTMACDCQSFQFSLSPDDEPQTR